MSNSSYRNRLISLLACTLLAPGAVAAQDEEPNIDPFEPVNRVVFAFNDNLDRFLLRPVGKGYNAVLPQPVRTGIGNFFDNWAYPVTIVNGYLQGKFGQGSSDLGRFAVNSTLGVLGIFDVASSFGLEEHKEDFGLTFARWGIGQGPYIVLPVLGPSTVRNGIGLIGDTAVNPLIQVNNHTSERDKALLLWFIESRAALIGPDEVVQEAYDPYRFMRDAYLQNRAFLRNEGNGEEESEDSEFFEDEFEDF